MDEVLTIERDGRVVTLSLNRPEVMNALDPDMARSLRTQLESLAGDAAVRCVILRGAGGNFMAGGDVGFFHASLERLSGEGEAFLTPVFADAHGLIRALRRMPQPVIAAVEGAVAGFGVSLMAACDLAVASQNCQFSLAYCHIGTCPDGGGTWFLPRLIGLRRASELALLGESFDAVTAERIGLVNRVAGPGALESVVAELALRLARGSAGAQAATKALLNTSLEAGLDQQLDAEQQTFIRCAASDDFAEGVTAFVEKRKPDFN